MSQPQQLQIKTDDATLKGVYSSAMQVQHTKEEFVLDFMNLFPPAGTLNARVIVSPGHLKRIAAVLNDNLQKYESTFGPIVIADNPGEIGFRP